MSHGFYERLSLQQGASTEEVQDAYRRSLGELVRRIRQAQASGADTAVLEDQRRELEEAHEILSDPSRRRRYDHFRTLSRDELPEDPESFWKGVAPGWTDPAAAAAVDVLRSLTEVPVGETFGTSAPAENPRRPPPSPAPQPVVSMMSPEERHQRAQAAVAPVPEPGLGPPPPAPTARLLSPEELRGLVESFGYDGRFLQAVREARGARLDDVAAATKIATRYLTAIEENAFEKLPAAVFVKGYVREIAGFLDIEPEPVVEGYLALFGRERG